MCLLCAAGPEGVRLAQRSQVLQLLTLVEHPDALPAEAVLRLAREILVLTEAERTGYWCDPVVPPGPDIDDSR
jgi:hypothetical protein